MDVNLKIKVKDSEKILSEIEKAQKLLDEVGAIVRNIKRNGVSLEITEEKEEENLKDE